MKKLLLLTFALFAMAACGSDDNDTAPMNDNPSINDGVMTGSMNFYGVSRSTSPEGETFTDEGVHFEFVASAADKVTLYMHATRFAAAMPGIEMRLTDLPYEGEDKRLSVNVDSVVPEADITGEYLPYERFAITGFKCNVESVWCKVEFDCIGYEVVFEGRLVLDVK